MRGEVQRKFTEGDFSRLSDLPQLEVHREKIREELESALRQAALTEKAICELWKRLEDDMDDPAGTDAIRKAIAMMMTRLRCANLSRESEN